MNKREIQQRVIYLETLTSLTQAYAEIASRRMLKVRQGVLSAREFVTELDEIFREIRRSYWEKVVEGGHKGKKSEQITFLAHNGKTVSVLLSANTALYGDLMPRVFGAFATEVERGQTEATIVGRLGLIMFLSRFPDRPYSYFDFPDYGSDREKFLRIIRHLVQYEDIHVHFGQFKSLVNQETAFLDIAAESAFQKGHQEGGELVQYLFEPSLTEILMFFEMEMFASVLEQTMTESQLAKFAARMLAMDRANQNITQDLKRVRLQELKVMHELQNRKQLAALWSLMVIKKR